MNIRIPESFTSLLRDDVKAFANLATIMEDGSPQVTPVWFSWDGRDILINSAKGRLKDRNMRERPQVALDIVDPNDPYRYLQIRGEVVEITTEGARDHINFLSKKYTGSPVYGGNPSEVRVIYRVRPEHVSPHA